MIAPPSTSSQKNSSVPWWHLTGAACVSPLGVMAAIGLSSVWPPRMSMELAGGIRLIYEVAEEQSLHGRSSRHAQTKVESQVTSELLRALRRRIDPSRTKECVIRAVDARKIEIQLPSSDESNLADIKLTISTSGFLQFLIVANQRDHSRAIDQARRQAETSPGPQTRIVRNDKGEPVGLWAAVGRGSERGDLKVSVAHNTIRDATTGQLLEVPSEHLADDERQFTQYLASLGIHNVDVLMATDDGFDVTGQHVASVSRAFDERMRPCILFGMSGEGTELLAGLTQWYSPDGSFQRQLGLVLDNTLLTAPNIQEPITQGRGRVTGDFSDAEVQFIINVLQAGTLPLSLSDKPVVEVPFASNPQAVRAAQGAIVTSLAFTLIAVIVLLAKYRWFGFVAVLATANHLAMLLVLPMINTTLTLAVIVTLAVLAVVAVLLHAYNCHCLARGEPKLLPATLIAVGCVASCMIASGGFIAGDFVVRSISAAIFSGAFAGLVVQVSVWLLPTLGMILFRSNNLDAPRA